jgi:hypothetical protein
MSDPSSEYYIHDPTGFFGFEYHDDDLYLSQQNNHHVQSLLPSNTNIPFQAQGKIKFFFSFLKKNLLNFFFSRKKN